MAAPWERRPRESNQAFLAFEFYRGLELNRSIERTCQGLDRGPHYVRLLERWTTRWGWVERARAWDTHLQRKRDRVAVGEHETWERRRLRSMAEAWRMSLALTAKAREMLKFPLEREVVTKYSDGREKTVKRPSRWTMASAATLVKLAYEMQVAVLGDALPRGDDDF